MAKLSIVAGPFVALLAACAHSTATHSVVLPTSAELQAYVTARWNMDFNDRFGRFAGRSGQPFDLVSVQNARCVHAFAGSVAECSFDVTARSGGSEAVTRQLRSQFERGPDGYLSEVLVTWHHRKG